MSADLVFRSAQTNDPNLVFGSEDGPPPATDATISVVASLPGLRGAVRATMGHGVSVVATMPKLRGAVSVVYESSTARPLVADVGSLYQDGTHRTEGPRIPFQEGVPCNAPVHAPWQNAAPLSSGFRGLFTDGVRLSRPNRARYQDGIRASKSTESGFQDGVRVRAESVSRFQDGVGLQLGRTTYFQDALRDRRNFTAGKFQDAIRYSTGVVAPAHDGMLLTVLVGSEYQDAMRPPPGIWVRPGPEPEDPCYIPDANLVFVEGPGGPNLVFVCERHGPGPEPGETVVVPVKRVYMVLNEATLRRVSDNALVPTLSMSMSIDVDSWTWSFSAALPWQALPLVDLSSADPVEVKATVNGAEYRFLIEKIGTERSFGKNAVRVSGRGKSALLDSPYAPSMFFGNTASRTAQQLMGDVLTLNGVPLDWTVNWGITDWTVPGNVWTHQGSYMGALMSIAAAPGAYIQPHPTLQQLYVLPRYPAMPHQWGDLTPDFDIPAAVMSREGIERVDLPMYDRVFVSGTSAGVLGQVTRAGTSGELIAPMVTDALITHADAARQRGLAELSKVGRQQNVTLRMPVLEETGIIPPGKLVLYRDGGVERLGFTRSVQVEVGLPDIWQSIGVETYA